MYRTLFYFSLFCSLSLTKGLEINPKLIKDFLESHNTKAGTVFYCNANIKTLEWMENVENFFLSFRDVSNQKQSLASANQMLEFHYRRLAVIFDMTCDRTEEFISEFSRLNRFNSSYTWLLLSDNLESAQKILESKNINLDSEITLATSNNDKEFNLHDVYNPSFRTNGNLIIEQQGWWAESRRNEIIPNKSKLDRRSDLKGVVIHCGVVASGIKPNQTLLEYMESEDDLFLDPQHRHSYQLFKILAEKHNFSIFLHGAPLWGILRNGTYDGVLGMFQNDQIEVSITPFRFTPDRIDLFDFTIVTWVTTQTIVFRHPQAGMRNIFLQPLAVTVWASIFVLIVSVSILIATVMTIKPIEVRNMSLVRSFVILIAVLCQQGYIENIRKLSVRIILHAMIVFSMIVYQFYSSFIVSSLLTDSPKTINNLQQLIDSRLKVGVENITYNIDFFQTTTDRLAIDLYRKKIQQTESFYEVNRGLDLMQKGGFAFQVDTSYAYRLIKERFTEKQISELHEMFLFPIRPLAVPVSKGSPYRDFISVGLLRLIETGIVSYHTQKWSATKPKVVKSNNVIESVGIEKASAIFILLAGAILASFFIVCLEICHFRRYHAKVHQRK